MKLSEYIADRRYQSESLSKKQYCLARDNGYPKDFVDQAGNKWFDKNAAALKYIKGSKIKNTQKWFLNDRLPDMKIDEDATYYDGRDAIQKYELALGEDEIYIEYINNQQKKRQTERTRLATKRANITYQQDEPTGQKPTELPTKRANEMSQQDESQQNEPTKRADIICQQDVPTHNTFNIDIDKDIDKDIDIKQESLNIDNSLFIPSSSHDQQGEKYIEDNTRVSKFHPNNVGFNKLLKAGLCQDGYYGADPYNRDENNKLLSKEEVLKRSGLTS